jgi:hypothetical protein
MNGGGVRGRRNEITGVRVKLNKVLMGKTEVNVRR